MRILVVEDEPTLAAQLAEALRLAGYTVDTAADGADAHYMGEVETYDVVVLDLGLPVMDGLTVLKQWRAAGRGMPVLILTARSNWHEKVAGIDAGADDYLTKPFGVSELLARLRVLLRRHARGGAGSAAEISFGDVRVDFARRVVERGGQHVHLTAMEYRLLAALLAHRGKVMTHRELLREVWGPSHVESNHYLRIYMGHLRQKLEADPAQPVYLLTEIGVGYRFAG